LADSLRTVSILKEKKVPILGVIKNMSNLFGGREEAFRKFLEDIKAPLLFELPFLEEFSEKETLPEIFSKDKKKEVLQNLAKEVLKRIFRIH
jgi:ATP-binding protein involved in chromosome partitioning